jgi:hypothetical protein
MASSIRPPYPPMAFKMTILMLFEVAPISTFSRVNKIGTPF